MFIAQFVKGMRYSEHAALERLADRVTVRQFGRRCFIKQSPDRADLQIAKQGLAECKEVILAGNHQLVVLDEASVAVALGLFPVEALLELICLRSDPIELVVTGRWAHPQLIQAADLVTEMREVKHYYREGVAARAGIEK